MRRNDFFKYLLFGRGSGSSASQSELEAENFPYTFTNNGHRLKNYRIYGANGGVGDYDSTEEKYVIPIQINGTAVNIYLDSPLSDGDYIDFYEQKRFNADDSAETVFIPALQISSGINVLDVGTEVQPSKIYIKGNISTFDVSNWANVQKLVRAGLHDKYFKIGDQLVCQKGGSDLTWDIIGLDHDTPTDSQYTHSMTLQLHDCLPSTMQFDAPEALYYAENGLAAGTYNFTIQSGYDTAYGGGKTYQFTLESAITDDAPYQLTFGWAYNTQAANAKITIYDKDGNQVGEPIGVTEGSSGTSIGTTDGTSTNLNHIHRVRFGSNNYGESAIRQFLNSSAVAGSVWTPQTKYDRPPSWNASTAGFISDLDSDFLAVIGSVRKVTALNTVTDGGGSVTLDDKFFLFSRSEVYSGLENNINEGEPYPYYSDYSDLSAAGTAADTNRIKYRSGTAQVWWLRSPYFASGHHVRYVHMNGNVSYYNFADSSYGVAPACNII